jgi:Protein of unknown function (DUF3159)
VVQDAAAAAERRDGEDGLSRPTVGSILLGGLPGALREGVLPVGAFYAGLKLSGLAAGMGAAAAASIIIYVLERRAGRDGLLVRLSLAFVAVQTLVGVISDSATAYLAVPVLTTAVWGLAFLGSAAIRRPLVGVLACAWYPFPQEFRQTDLFKRVYGVESVVWGLYMLSRSALRLLVLLSAGAGGYLVLVITGTPLTIALLVWSVWYAVRRFEDDDGDAASSGESHLPEGRSVSHAGVF